MVKNLQISQLVALTKIGVVQKNGNFAATIRGRGPGVKENCFKEKKENNRAVLQAR